MQEAETARRYRMIEVIVSLLAVFVASATVGAQQLDHFLVFLLYCEVQRRLTEISVCVNVRAIGKQQLGGFNRRSSYRSMQRCCFGRDTGVGEHFLQNIRYGEFVINIHNCTMSNQQLCDIDGIVTSRKM